MATEEHIERLPHRRHLGILQRAFGKDRRMAGGQQHLVALAERDFEVTGEQQHHFGARPRAARLDKAQVAGRDAGLEGQVELGALAPVAPLPQERPRPGGYQCTPFIRCAKATASVEGALSGASSPFPFAACDSGNSL